MPKEAKPLSGFQRPAVVLYDSAEKLSPNNAADIDYPTKGIVANSTGQAFVTFYEDTDGTGTLITLEAGVVYGYVVKRLWSDSLTVTTSIIGLY